MRSEPFFHTIAELAALLDAGKLSSVELTKAVVARTKAVDARVKAFNSYDENDALDRTSVV
jgi:aspartyl-tRNA(Asn)/glutamyl-tRNA(Gln) amidotransferase subunit A